MNPLIIIPCGGKKALIPQPAQSLYVGGYFRQCLNYALAKTTPDRVRILSGKYGLLKLDQLVAPYEQRLGARGSITLAEIIKQAEEQGISKETNVVIVAGKTYARYAKMVWPSGQWLLENRGGLGHQMKFLKEAAKR
jgi:cytoplasmic iron level regulating protein YaaA (DUF328/UPF0246 family)